MFKISQDEFGGDRKEFYVAVAHLLSDNDCGAPAFVYIKTHTSTMLFAGAFRVSVKSNNGAESFYVQRVITDDTDYLATFHKGKNGGSPVFMHVVYISLELVCFGQND